MISLRAPWWTIPLATIGFLLVWTGTASAQSLSVTYDHRAYDPPANRDQLAISRSDCQKGDSFVFNVTASGYSGYSFEVWVGTTCATLASRSSTTQTCIKVAERTPIATFSVDLPVQAIVTTPTTGAGVNVVKGDISACTPDTTIVGSKQVTLYFLLTQENVEAQVSQTWSTTVDLVGPPAPTGATAGFGDTMLAVDWTPQSDLTDVAGYRFYCDPVPGQESADAGATTMAGDAGDVDVLVPNDASDDAADDASSDAGGDAEAGTPSDAGATDAATPEAGSTGTLPSNCPATTRLVEGQIPDEAFYCGSVSTGSATSGKITGLKNGVTYAVAVAAVDALENTGPLSNIACDAPGPVDDFFDLYKEAGGAGGGGFCSLGSVPGVAGHAGAAGTILALAAVALLRRRTRR